LKSSYKRIGDYIELVDERNKELNVDLLLGLSISKQFIPSVANTVGADMSNYKIIKKGQFACSIMQVRRDGKMPIALLQDFDEAIISQAYPVFRVIDENKLLPEYLMMWFSRSEFDRQATFHAVGGVRGSLEWDDFLDFELPIPSIEKQQEIVTEYNTITNRIALNEQLNQKLEETAQAVYKHWFVDFEFPDNDGKPYKSSGGKMIYNEELDDEIPEGWQLGTLDFLSSQFSGFSFKGDKYSYSDGVTVVRGENITEKRLRWDTHKKWDLELDDRMKKCFLKPNDIVIGMDGSKVGKNWSLVSELELPLLLAQRVTSVRGNNGYESFFLYLSIDVLNFTEYVAQVQTGTSVPHISGQQIKDFPMVIPEQSNLIAFDSVVNPLFNQIYLNINFSKKLEDLIDLLLSKMTKVDEEIVQK